MRILLILGLIFVAAIVYLNRSYAYFYDFQGDHFIGNPSYPQRMQFDNFEATQSAKVVVLGDSLMAGTGSTSIENSMAYLIGKEFAKDKKITVVNLATPGVGVVDVLQRQLPALLDEKPDYVVLMIGTNDVHNRMSLGEFNNYINKLLFSLADGTDAKVTVVNIPYIGSDKIALWPWNKILSSEIVDFNKVISAHVSGKKNFKRVDLYSEFNDEFRNHSALYALDEFHPSDKGYALWADYINENLNR